MSQEGRDQPLLLDMRKEVGEPGRVGVWTLVLLGVSTHIFQRPRELVMPLLTRGCPATHRAGARGVAVSPGDNHFQGRSNSLALCLNCYRSQWSIRDEFLIRCGRPGLRPSWQKLYPVERVATSLKS